MSTMKMYSEGAFLSSSEQAKIDKKKIKGSRPDAPIRCKIDTAMVTFQTIEKRDSHIHTVKMQTFDQFGKQAVERLKIVYYD